MQHCQYKSIIQRAEDSLHQQTELKRMEEADKVLHVQHIFVRR